MAKQSKTIHIFTSFQHCTKTVEWKLMKQLEQPSPPDQQSYPHWRRTLCCLRSSPMSQSLNLAPLTWSRLRGSKEMALLLCTQHVVWKMVARFISNPKTFFFILTIHDIPQVSLLLLFYCRNELRVACMIVLLAHKITKVLTFHTWWGSFQGTGWCSLLTLLPCHTLLLPSLVVLLPAGTLTFLPFQEPWGWSILGSCSSKGLGWGEAQPGHRGLHLRSWGHCNTGTITHNSTIQLQHQSLQINSFEGQKYELNQQTSFRELSVSKGGTADTPAGWGRGTLCWDGCWWPPVPPWVGWPTGGAPRCTPCRAAKGDTLTTAPPVTVPPPGESATLRLLVGSHSATLLLLVWWTGRHRLRHINHCCVCK